MTINKSETVNIPKIWVIVVLPLLVGGVSGLVTSSFKMGQKSQQIETVVKSIDDLKKDKVSSEAFILLKEDIKDIKLDVKDLKVELREHSEKR